MQDQLPQGFVRRVRRGAVARAFPGMCHRDLLLLRQIVARWGGCVPEGDHPWTAWADLIDRQGDRMASTTLRAFSARYEETRDVH